MRNTVPAAAIKEGRSDDREWIDVINGSKRALDQRYEATFVKTTTASGAMETVWSSDDMPLNSAWEVRANVVCRSTAGGTARARYVIEGLFYRDMDAAVQEGATTASVTIESVAAFAVQFGVSGNGVILQVQDDGTRTVNWSALISCREVT